MWERIEPKHESQNPGAMHGLGLTVLPLSDGAENIAKFRANKLMRMGIVLYVQSLKVTCAGSVLCSRETEPKACCPPLFLRRLIEARKKSQISTNKLLKTEFVTHDQALAK